MRDPQIDLIEAAFDRDELKRICEMHEYNFAAEFGMTYVPVQQHAPDDFYLFRDNGADILAVAHLDTVGLHFERTCNFLDTAGGPVVYSRALDDRLGAYVILDLLPKLGVEVDLLLTVGEENGRSTAAFFDPSEHHDRQYNWMIEFDRGGTDVVMYQYDDAETDKLVRATGARTEMGIFSDICYLEHLGIKGFNWGVGYRDYHGPRAHAYLDDTFKMVGHFLDFHATNAEVHLPHEPELNDRWGSLGALDSGHEHDAYVMKDGSEWIAACDTCNDLLGVSVDREEAWAIAEDHIDAMEIARLDAQAAFA